MAHAANNPADSSRGRQAEKPHQIPGRGWKEILKRTVQDIRNDHVTIVAGGVAFFGLLGIIPAIAALISIYGLVADPAQIQQQFESIRGLVPGPAYELLSGQMQEIASSNTAAGWGAAISILLALWGGSKAVKALIEGLNIMYHEEEKRGFIKLSLTAFLMTLAGVAGVAIAIALIAVLPSVLAAFNLSESVQNTLLAVRWPLLLLFFMFALSFMYRYGPCRADPKWHWVTWGAALSALLWLAASGLFALYVSNFNSYNKTYGSLGAVVIMLMWFYLTAYVILLGAEMNFESERQTEKDSTTGEPKPMGQRGGFAPDTVA